MSRLRAPALLAATLLAPAAATADLLVTHDGATVETRGPWRVDGRRVIFTLPNGTLSSLAAAEIDLDESVLATARAAEAAARPATEAVAPAPREPVLRITESDIPPMTDVDEDAAAAGSGATTTPTGNVPLEVVSWDKLVIGDGEGIAVFGTLRNTGNETVISPALSVSVYGEEGGLLALDDAQINLGAIPAGKSANFRAEFAGLPDFAAVRFIPSGRGYEGRPPAGEVQEGGEETAVDETPVELEAEVEGDVYEEAEEPPPAG